MKVKILSIRQPWAWLIVNGFKDTENRTWPCPYQGRLYIHASKTMTRADYDACRIFVAGICESFDLPKFEDLGRGGIIGAVRMNGCVDESDSPWFTGDFGFVMEGAQTLPFYACKGQLGLYTMELPNEYCV